MRRLLTFLPVLLFILAVMGVAVYLAGTVALLPGGAATIAPFAATPTILAGTPVLRFNRVNPAIVDVLAYAPSNYGTFTLDVPGSGLVAVGAYLPVTGNTQFELIPPTPLPTPLPYPTSPPLPLPALPALLLPTVPALAEDGTSRTLPYAGDACAPAGNPVEGVLTQRYHAYHPGIDIGVPLGTPVLATHSGTVIFAGWSDIGYGYLVIIQNQGFITYYAHNTSFNVTVGQLVGKGSIIAWSGSTGNSTGPHVHYETRINDVPVDPLTFETRGYASC
ncbi:MAG: M23 family metallopeptidase [Anaerolineae bacterium]|jgi:murein DD-endopeptidase MepM/ murein hydrolase activator NlpD|nr:M23 family metallopeptidase [Anaerolineae bacterium]